MDSDTRATIEASLSCALSPIIHARDQEHHNVHYRGMLPDGTSVFVKLINDHPAYYTAEVCAAHHLARAPIRTPLLITHGVLDSRRRWLAYQWHDLGPFIPVPHHIEQAGEMLGRLHAATTGLSDPRLRRYTSIHALIAEKTAQVARLDAALASRIQRLHDAMTSQDNADLDDSACLLHGDAGWRNFHADRHDQQIWLIDFEHAAIGHPLLDFAKLWTGNSATRQSELCSCPATASTSRTSP